jgi:predicted secreted protein
MSTEMGILTSFCVGSHGQRILLAVGFSLPTIHARRKLCGDHGDQYWDIKGTHPCFSL